MPNPLPSRRPRRSGLLGLAAAAGLALLIAAAGPVRAADSGNGGDGPPRFSIDDIVDYFDTIVFGSELDPAFASNVIAKWQKKTITIGLQRGITPQLLGFIKTHVAELQKYTPLKFSGTKDPANADIQMLFVHKFEMDKIPVPPEYRAAMQKAAFNSNCYFLTWKSPPSRIVKAVIAIDIDKDAPTLNSCLLEELTQSLGLPNDSDLLRPSIFSDHDQLTTLAPQDRLLLHTLYDPRMKAGMSHEEALKTAREILVDLVRSRAAKQSTPRGPGG